MKENRRNIKSLFLYIKAGLLLLFQNCSVYHAVKEKKKLVSNPAADMYPATEMWNHSSETSPF